LAAVHHPCPAAREPASLTSPDPETRDRAVAQLRRTLATARRLRAPAVVVHLGRIESGGDGRGERLRFELLSRYAAGMRTTDRYRTVLGELAALREEAEPACLDRAADGLAAVLHDARDSGVEIGLETGFDVLDLPTPEGMRRLMRDFGGNGLRAWLDTGHVGAIDNLGLASFAEWSAATGSRWLGAHCHDVVGLRDHLVPGAGQLDFATLAEHLPRKAIVTCEVDWYFTPEEVTAGAQHLRLALAVADP
jgi:sugar phosphate isomerase/epimerase